MITNFLLVILLGKIHNLLLLLPFPIISNMEEYTYDSDLETLLREGLLASMDESYLNNVMPSTPLDPALGPIYAGSNFPSEESLAESDGSRSYAPPPPDSTMDDFAVQQFMHPAMSDFMYQPPPTFMNMPPQPADFLTDGVSPSNGGVMDVAAITVAAAPATTASSGMLSVPAHQHQHHQQQQQLQTQTQQQQQQYFSQSHPPQLGSSPGFIYKSEYAYPPSSTSTAVSAQPILYPDMGSQNPPTASDQCYVRKACVGCKQSHVACDSARPCARCKRLNKSEQCVDAERKKRGRPSGSGKKKDHWKLPCIHYRQWGNYSIIDTRFRNLFVNKPKLK